MLRSQTSLSNNVHVAKKQAIEITHSPIDSSVSENRLNEHELSHIQLHYQFLANCFDATDNSVTCIKRNAGESMAPSAAGLPTIKISWQNGVNLYAPILLEAFLRRPDFLEQGQAGNLLGLLRVTHQGNNPNTTSSSQLPALFKLFEILEKRYIPYVSYLPIDNDLLNYSYNWVGPAITIAGQSAQLSQLATLYAKLNHQIVIKKLAHYLDEDPEKLSMKQAADGQWQIKIQPHRHNSLLVVLMYEDLVDRLNGSDIVIQLSTLRNSSPQKYSLSLSGKMASISTMMNIQWGNFLTVRLNQFQSTIDILELTKEKLNLAGIELIPTQNGPRAISLLFHLHSHKNMTQTLLNFFKKLFQQQHQVFNPAQSLVLSQDSWIVKYSPNDIINTIIIPQSCLRDLEFELKTLVPLPRSTPFWCKSESSQDSLSTQANAIVKWIKEKLNFECNLTLNLSKGEAQFDIENITLERAQYLISRVNRGGDTFSTTPHSIGSAYFNYQWKIPVTSLQQILGELTHEVVSPQTGLYSVPTY